MALFNKLFSSRKNCCKNQDAACDKKVFVFSKDQVRVVLFRECDFWGRKLLFDSESAEKIPLASTLGSQVPQSCTNTTRKSQECYIEISNGYGYQYTKPCTDIGQLGEMVFGSVAMSYRGTSLKIHSLTTPTRLMCSQIFPSPRQPARSCCSAPTQCFTRSSITSLQSLEQSYKLNDSCRSSANSTSDRSSLNDPGSDTLLICKGSCSVPLDVPTSRSSADYSVLTPSVIGDSGFSGEQSYNSLSSGPQSLPTYCMLNKIESTFSSGSLYKRWLRGASTSLEHSANSLTGSASADECLLKPHSRSSKLGLAILIKLPDGQEQFLEQFIMEHAALIESMVWRTRQGAEIAYLRHNNFVSLMFDVAANAIQWIVDLLSGPQLSSHMWISLAPICDKFYSINSSDRVKKGNNCVYSNSANQSDASRTLSLDDLRMKYTNDPDTTLFSNSSSCISLTKSFQSDIINSFDSTNTLDKSSDFTFIHLTNFLKHEWATVSAKSSFRSSDKNVMAEKYVTELCELLECIDIKHTNFFVSTLITAVLTHHLGWVTTVLPPSRSDKEKVSELRNPCNPLWGQLTDLYGAIGHPTKVAHTIITGTNKAELISKILNSLTYFIRCSDMERKCVTRLDMEGENTRVDCICQQKSCIPKENYKKYEDHLREMEVCSSNNDNCNNNVNKINNAKIDLTKSTKEIIKCRSVTENIEMHTLSIHKGDKQADKILDSEFTTNNRIDLLKNPNSVTNGFTKPNQDDNIIFNTPKRLYPSLEELCREENVILDDLHTNQFKDTKMNNNNHILNKIKSLGIQAVNNPKEFEITNTIINEKVRRLCRVPNSAVLYHVEPSKEEQQLIDIQEASDQILKIFAPKRVSMEKQMKSSDCEFKEISKSEVFEENKQKSIIPDNKDDKVTESNVIFVLGDDEELVGLKKARTLENSSSTSLNAVLKPNDSTEDPLIKDNGVIRQYGKPTRPTTLNLGLSKSKSTFFNVSSDDSSQEHDDLFLHSAFKDSDFMEYRTTSDDLIKPSTSWSAVNKNSVANRLATTQPLDPKDKSSSNDQKGFNRSQSVPPETKTESQSSRSSSVKSKYRYSGVKFNFQQYPQIVTNYMRSKNLELSQLSFTEKAMKLNNFGDYPSFDFLNCDSQLEEVETLQTPSNASELEFTSDLVTENHEMQHAKEKIDQNKSRVFTRNVLANTVVKEPQENENKCVVTLKQTTVVEHPLQLSKSAIFEGEESQSSEDECFSNKEPRPNRMQIVEIPMPKSQPVAIEGPPVNYTSSLMRGICDRYISDMVLQGTSAPKSEWESILRRDLSLALRHPLLDQPVDEAIAIIANTDTWEVQLMSSHTYVVDRGSSGVRVGMSQLVANMLESLLHLWKLHTPPEYCIMHIEHRLQEFCMLSKALAELLLATEFCSMDLLTSVLQLEVNDVPLLMAVASTHSPQVTQKYGLSFQ